MYVKFLLVVASLALIGLAIFAGYALS